MWTLCLLAFTCFVGTYAIPADQRYHPDALECAEDSNFDLEVFWNKDQSMEGFRPPEEYYCFESCMMHKRMKQQGFETIHEGLINAISFVDMAYDHFKDKPYTREELEHIAIRCNAAGLSECDYLRCIKLLDAPFSNFFMTAAL